MTAFRFINSFQGECKIYLQSRGSARTIWRLVKQLICGVRGKLNNFVPIQLICLSKRLTSVSVELTMIRSSNFAAVFSYLQRQCERRDPQSLLSRTGISFLDQGSGIY